MSRANSADNGVDSLSSVLAELVDRWSKEHDGADHVLGSFLGHRASLARFAGCDCAAHRSASRVAREAPVNSCAVNQTSGPVDPKLSAAIPQRTYQA